MRVCFVLLSNLTGTKMDDVNFSAFSSDDFDPIEWLNNVFTKPGENNDERSKDSETLGTNLVFKLQMMIEETNNSLQEIAQRMELSVPKVVGEAEVLGKEVKDLCNHVIDVRSKLLCTEQQSSQAIDSLVKLDTAKQRLQETYKSLQEANNWTTLTLDVDEVFENGDITQVFAKLFNMQTSLQMLSLSCSSSNSQDIRGKLELVESLKNRFELMVEPMLHEALANQNTESIASYSKLFRDLHRSDRLIVFYQTSLRDQLLREWSTQVALDSKETLLDWLNFLYDRLITIWKTQMNLCMKVLYSDDYESSLQVLCNIYTDIILSLHPSIVDCFQRCSQSKLSDDGKAWRQKSLIELKHLTNQFVRSIEQNIVSSSGHALDSSLIKRVPSLDSFVRTIYRPFVILHEQFVQLERDRLGGELASISCECTSIVVCSEHIHKLFCLARESLKLYQSYVESYPILIVEDVLQDLLLRFLAHIRTNLNQTLSSVSVVDTEAKSTSAPVTPNWSLVQQTLFAFQVVGDFLLQLDNFQQQVTLCLEEAKEKIGQEGEESYLARFDVFILNLDTNQAMRERIEAYIQSSRNIHTGQTILLERVLNESVKLAKLTAQAICDSVMEYVQVYLVNLFASIRQQMLGDDESHETVGSFSPHEYITQIGQYLLTLPQHLEPFNPNESAPFKLALRHSIHVFSGQFGLASETTTEVLLDSILRQTTKSFLDHILRLPSCSATPLAVNIRKQIGVDLAYLAAVCEDLGLTADKEYRICMQVFNDVHDLDSLKRLQSENVESARMLRVLESLIKFE